MNSATQTPELRSRQHRAGRTVGDPASAGVTIPVTVTVARVVSPGHRAEFERWAVDIQQLMAGFPGHLGSSLLRPAPGGNEYHVLYRFSDAGTLRAWEESPERAAALARVQALMEDVRYARSDGLVSFFTVPPTPGPRWRITLLTVAAVFALTTTFRLLVTPLLAGSAWPLQLAVSAVFVVLALGFVVMPALTRVFAGWLRPRR